MAGAGYRDWTAGEKPTADQFDTYLQQQTVMVFASAAARNTALSAVLSEGLLAFLLDTNTLTVYSGSAWSTVGPVHGALTSWTPTVTQSGSVTVTNVYSRYVRVGRMIMGWFNVSSTSAGTANNPILISLPVTAASSGFTVGAFELGDVSATTKWAASTYLESTTTMSLRLSTAVQLDNRAGMTGSGANITLASGDLINGSFQYEAAADA